jgi:hypothetical protein
LREENLGVVSLRLTAFTQGRVGALNVYRSASDDGVETSSVQKMIQTEMMSALPFAVEKQSAGVRCVVVVGYETRHGSERKKRTRKNCGTHNGQSETSTHTQHHTMIKHMDETSIMPHPPKKLARSAVPIYRWGRRLVSRNEGQKESRRFLRELDAQRAMSGRGRNKRRNRPDVPFQPTHETYLMRASKIVFKRSRCSHFAFPQNPQKSDSPHHFSIECFFITS